MDAGSALPSAESQALVLELRDYIERCVRRLGGTRVIRPSHRQVFRWPPESVSAAFHIHPSDWSGSTRVEIDGVEHRVELARTPYGIFGRVEGMWHEARGDSDQDVLDQLITKAEPLLLRQRAAGIALELEGRFMGHVSELDALGLLKLLYCTDRDVGADAGVEIEARASQGIFAPALITILRDDRHPYRRVAQWFVLDMFEDLPSFCPDDESAEAAISAIRGLMWEADDDYARAVYKAGIVLGGHICTDPAASALLDCITAPSRIGRRSAIHAVFHLNEWCPDYRQRILDRLAVAAETDPEPKLRKFARHMLEDIKSGATDHVTEPRFKDEPEPATPAGRSVPLM